MRRRGEGGHGRGGACQDGGALDTLQVATTGTRSTLLAAKTQEHVLLLHHAPITFTQL